METLQYLSPFRVFRRLVRVPVETFVERQYSTYKRRTAQGISSVRELLYRAAIISLFVTAIVWTSVFMYVVFYYTYMPNVAHARPVHLQFEPCEDNGMCSFPSAHVQLTRRSRMLMPAQPYRIRLVLEMPESQPNKDVGMFMVCAQMRAKGGVLVSSSCRSAMLKYRSRLHCFLRTVCLSPLFLLGAEETQTLSVELYADFVDDADRPVTDAYVELQSRRAQLYSAELQLEAHFAGVRHIMYHWPRVSCAVGICTNLFFVSLVFVLSWYHLQDGLPEFVKNKLRKDSISADDKKFIGKIKLEPHDKPIFDDDKFLEGFPPFTLEKDQD